MECIKVKELAYSYDGEHNAVDKVSFTIQKGSYTTIIGHNGSGKSTIAKLLIGLLEKNHGSVEIEGMELNLANIYKIRNKVGIVFQNPDNQFIGSTVRDDIAFGLENHCVAQQDMDDIIENFAQKVNMQEFLDSEPGHLSGGQKQRVAIAGVLAMHPEIIIFDESTSMLDPQGKDEIKKFIYQLHQDKQLTIISITHDIEEVASSDDVIVMNDGKIVMHGKPEDILLNDQKLIDIKLDVPFGVKLSLALAKQGVKIDKQLSLEKVVDEICQLNLKK
ncbi:MAG: energy-coupling factor transporter ATPase [Erysipelotrichaceae bacterium]|nr:energy-coupling factor transporter ATPase [Erysipelotrichaceae bacterium]MDY5251476.1 energy-coupling factor transporter ATPase [Erysipelotrichaceae bacterium]